MTIMHAILILSQLVSYLSHFIILIAGQRLILTHAYKIEAEKKIWNKIEH